MINNESGKGPLEEPAELNAEEEQGQALIVPVEQHTLLFYGQPILVVRLPDGRPAVVLGSICENMKIDSYAQIKRIRRTEAIADDLVTNVRVEPIGVGGPQAMAVLVLRSVAYWLATIDAKRVREDVRSDVVRYQREAVDALYAWAQNPKASLEASTQLIPAKPVTQPIKPEPDAPLSAWHEYYTRMAALVEWQMDVERWRGTVESRLEGVEAMTGLIPEILERLGPQTITTQHQRQVQVYVKQLCQLTGKSPNTVYEDVKTAFEKPRYQDLLESEWEKVETWFRIQIDRVRKK